MENYSVIELPVCGGETGPLTLFADLGHRHFLVPNSNHAAEALQVLCWRNVVVSTPASAIILVIQRAKVCEDTDL